MVLTSVAAGAAIGGTVSVYEYNRTGWLTDILLRQQQRYRKQSVRQSQAGMFREDIRDLASCSVSRLNNYIILATLLLGMAVASYLQAGLPEGSAEFAITLYFLCMGSSQVYLILAIFCAVNAQQMAIWTQRELLITFVRIPVAEFVEDIHEGHKMEQSRSFEHQGLGYILRVPGLSRFRSASQPASSRSTSLKKHKAKRSEELPHQERVDMSLPDEQLEEPEEESQAKKAERHLVVYKQRERQWKPFIKASFLFCLMGFSHLLQGFGYFVALKQYVGSTWGAWISQALICVVDATLAVAYMRPRGWMMLVSGIVTFGGPLVGSAAIRGVGDSADSACVVLCFISHFLWNIMGLTKLIMTSVNAPTDLLPEIHVEDDTNVQTFDEAALPFHHKLSGHPGAAIAAVKVPITPPVYQFDPVTEAQLYRQRTLIPFVNVAVTFAWLASIIWAIVRISTGTVEDGIIVARQLQVVPTPATFAEQVLNGLLNSTNSSDLCQKVHDATLELDWQSRALLRQSEPLENLTVQWPSVHFRPHAVACGGERCFLANEFQVYELLASGSGHRLAVVPCAVPGTIVDLTVRCGTVRCEPMVLSDGELLSCSGASERLPRGFAGQHVTFSQGHLLAADGQNVVEMAPTDGEWVQLWHVADEIQRRGQLAGLDTVIVDGSSHAFLLRAAGLVDTLDDGAVCGTWALADAKGISGGCVERSNAHETSLLLLIDGPSVTLARARLPEPGALCTLRSVAAATAKAFGEGKI